MMPERQMRCSPKGDLRVRERAHLADRRTPTSDQSLASHVATETEYCISIIGAQTAFVAHHGFDARAGSNGRTVAATKSSWGIINDRNPEEAARAGGEGIRE